MSTYAGEAVVIGAGMAGLAATRVLSDRFDRVTLLDRDALPDGARPRRGVPQGAHAHALLAVGREVLEALFPGLTDELMAAGAPWFDIVQEGRMWQLGGYRYRYPSGIDVLSLTRPLLETAVRRRVAALPNVTVRDGVAAEGLTGEAGVRVTGVSVADGWVAADLVVDATGRGGARADHWLRALGFPVPVSSTVTMRMAYATRVLRRSPDDCDWRLAIVVQSPPGGRRFGGAFPVEDDRWLVTLGGWHGDHPSTDDDGYRLFAKSLPAPEIADLLARAEPLTDVVTYQYPTARRRHFERLRAVPAGYVVVGDASCSFNPAYGQGMTVAAQEAQALARCLDEHRVPSAAFVRAYYRRAARIIDVPWDLASGADFAYPQTIGKRPLAGRLLDPYMRRVVLASQVSPRVHDTLARVQHLLAPPSALLRPGYAVRALRAARLSPGRAEARRG